MSRTRFLAGVLAGAAALVLVVACQSDPVGSAGSSTAGQSVVAASPTPSASVTVPTSGSSSVDPSTSVPSQTSGETSVLPTSSSVPSTTSTPTVPPKPAAKITASPKFGTAGIEVLSTPKVSVADGTITALTMTNPDGKKIKGKLAADKKSWVVAEELGYGKTYTVSGAAKGENGKSVKISGTWTTLTPDAEITTNVSPGDGAVVGVAAPIIIRFGLGADDKALIEKNVTITTTPKVDGAFAWITHDGDDYESLDWRPKHYWPENTKVHVEANMYGVKFSGNYYGGYDVTSDFSIGSNQVVYADANAHNLVVKRDGKTVATYEASYGSGDLIGDPKRVTRSGIHIVMDKQEHTKMSNPAYGYVNIDEYWAVRISNNGEFIHENPYTVDSQGYVNVSHGCVNLSPESAEAYFNSAIYGDPVEVTGTSVQLSAADGDVYDWAIPWKEWVSLGATNS